jgi:DNA-binding NtrC family response regulator
VSAILIVDDEEIHARAIARFLTRRGHACEVATSAAGGRTALGASRPDLVLLDVRLGDDDGVQILREIRQQDAGLPVIMMTAYGSVETAVNAMKAGALDYVQKPIDLEELALIVGRALGEARTREFLERLQRSQAGWTDEIVLLGQSPAMQPVHAFVERAARFEGLAAGEHPTILVLGETGTGKGLVARILHARSSLARQPFIALDCTALPRDLIEAELFGYERGAFTDAKTAKPGLLEVASGGTLFLDEIAELSLDAQGKLLRMIEEKKVRRVGGLADTRVDVRIIAATNRDLARLAAEGQFRRDLLYRLDVLTVTLPPLRERGDDIEVLANHYIAVYARKYGRPPKRLAADAAAALRTDPWIGNVRELAHVIERATLLVDGETMEARHLARGPGVRPAAAESGGAALPPDATLEQVERQLIRDALERSSWNISLAARRLGVSREVLRYRMRKHAITVPEESAVTRGR